MTIIEAINRIDLLKPNTFTQLEKVRWLSTLDGIIKTEILDKHEGDSVQFSGYDDSTIVTTALLVPAPYDDVYLFWLESKIDYWNAEYGKYNNSISMFNAAYSTYENYYNNMYLPKGKKRFLF